MRRTVCLAVCTALVLSSGGAGAFGATGDKLIGFDSSLGTIPREQGWSMDADCLKSRCPDNANNPLWWYSHPLTPGGTDWTRAYVGECFYQGQRDVPEVAGNYDGNPPGGLTGGDQVPDNNCTQGIGCNTSVEHYNASVDVTDIMMPWGMPAGVYGACRKIEWLAFDDGEDYIGAEYPVDLPNRNLTFPDSYWGPHTVPAYGAPSFLNAPSYPVLRVVAGGGVPSLQTVPDYDGARNQSTLKLRKTFTMPQGVTAVTVVAKMAAGNQSPGKEMLQLRAFNYAFSVGVNGLDGDPNLGQIGCGPENSDTAFMFGDKRVDVRLARMGVWGGANTGEFFTIRVILRNDGTVSAWLNDSTSWAGNAGVKNATPEVQFGSIDRNGATMWFDYVRLYEGEVLPGCSDPVFDINSDGKVNNEDLVDHLYGFLTCATGPTPGAAAFAALPDMCKCHDVNNDQAIDMTDYAVFQRCISIGAPDGMADPACDNLP